MNQTHAYLDKWHQGLQSQDQEFLNEILDDFCVFTSPIVFKPIEGKEMSKLYLMGAGKTFDMNRFEYVRELVDGLDTVLEFETYIDDISVNGVDIIRWTEEGKIVDFKVMIRPLQAIGALLLKGWCLACSGLPMTVRQRSSARRRVRQRTVRSSERR